MTQTAEVINFKRPVVKADIENGFTRIANELTEALMLNPARLCGREYQIVQAIIYKTFRFHKKSDWITNSQISEMTGIAQSKISELKKSLIEKHVLVVEGKHISINTTVSEWADYPKTGKAKVTQKRVNTYPNSGNELPKNGYKITRKGVTHKKDNKTKDNTNKTSKFAPEKIDLPDFLPEQLWCEFVQHRKDIKKPLTELATTKLINQLSADFTAGLDIVEAINQSIASRWAGVFPKGHRGQRGNPTPENFSRKNYGEIKGSF